MNVRGKKVTVIGLGRTSAALVRLLLREGALPFVTDNSAGPKLAPFCQELARLGVPYECGGHTAEAFRDAALVIPSPGVPPTLPVIEEARKQGAMVMGEMEFAFPYCRSRIIAVTGTNGKTTTTELLRCLVAACGRTVALAGNNDTPFSAVVQADMPPEFVVLEVSSYQLETVMNFRPWAGVVLNVTPDHLARHGTLEGYADVKARLFQNQAEGDIALINADDPLVRTMAVPNAADRWTFSLDVPGSADLWIDGDTIVCRGEVLAQTQDTPLRGRHNLQNVLAALGVMRAGGFDWPATIAGLRSFTGVEHRIEHVLQLDGVDYYNDSKSTNVDSLKVALESFDAPVVLIAGGRGKGSDYGVLRDLVAAHVKHLVAIGEDAPLLLAAFGAWVPCERAESMEDAVACAARAASPGNAVLLSPACASFDMFADFEDRGRVFKAVVQALAAQRNAPAGKQP